MRFIISIIEELETKSSPSPPLAKRQAITFCHLLPSCMLHWTIRQSCFRESKCSIAFKLQWDEQLIWNDGVFSSKWKWWL